MSLILLQKFRFPLLKQVKNPCHQNWPTRGLTLAHFTTTRGGRAGRAPVGMPSWGLPAPEVEALHHLMAGSVLFMTNYFLQQLFFLYTDAECIHIHSEAFKAIVSFKNPRNYSLHLLEVHSLHPEQTIVPTILWGKSCALNVWWAGSLSIIEWVDEEQSALLVMI